MSKKFLTENMTVALKEIVATGKSNNTAHRVQHLEKRKLISFDLTAGVYKFTALGRLWVRQVSEG